MGNRKGLSPLIAVLLLVAITIGISIVLTKFMYKYTLDLRTCNSDICIMCNTNENICGAFLQNTTMPIDWEVVSNCDIVCDNNCYVNCTMVRPKKISKDLQIAGLVLNMTEYYNLTG